MKTNRMIEGLTLAACVTVGGCSPKVAKGNGYSLPIPAGWKLETETSPPPGGLAIRQKSKTNPDYMTASVVVAPVAPTAPPFDPTNAALCRELAEAIAKPAGSTVKGASIVDGPAGKTCQTDVLSGSGKQASLGTFVKLPRSAWVVTCNRDPRDQEAAKACEEALRGIKAD